LASAWLLRLWCLAGCGLAVVSCWLRLGFGALLVADSDLAAMAPLLQLL